MAIEKRYLSDKESLAALINLMPPAERAEFQDYRWMAMEPCFPSRRMVVYEFRQGRPTNVEMFHFGELAMGVKDTPTARLHFRLRDMLITPTPVQIPGREVFVSLPQNFVFRWAGQEIAGALEFRSHYAVLIKTRSRDALEIEGHTYCLTLKRFLDRYPYMADEVRY